MPGARVAPVAATFTVSSIQKLRSNPPCNQFQASAGCLGNHGLRRCALSISADEHSDVIRSALRGHSIRAPARFSGPRSDYAANTVTWLEIALRTRSSRVAGRRLSDEPFEVANQVGLIRVPKAGGKVGPVAWFACRRVLSRLVETVTLDDPFRADADVLTEKTLQGALAQSREANDSVDLRDFTVVGPGLVRIRE